VRGEILARKPDDEDAIKFLGKVLTESERWPELASLIGGRSSSPTPPVATRRCAT
jgi:hypothetical protein